MHCLKMRLNFVRDLAEELSMKKFDGFLALNIVIVAVLSYTYYYSANTLNYFEKNPALKAKYERGLKLQVLAKELKVLAEKNKTARVPASLGKANEVIVEPALDSNGEARRIFSDAQTSCNQKLSETECLNNIDIVISQFPDTIWAGESLLLLTEVYQKNKKINQIADVIKILKTDFKGFKSLQVKVNYLEKQNL